jgi:hypothetical protein
MANEAQGYAERASIRVIVAAVVGVAGAVVTGMLGSWDYAPSVGWDCGATVFLAWTWTVVATMDAAQTASHATREDPSKRATQLLVLGASIASLVAVGYLLDRLVRPMARLRGSRPRWGCSASSSLGWSCTPFSLCDTRWCTTPATNAGSTSTRPRPALHRLRLPRVHCRHDLPGLRHHANHPRHQIDRLAARAAVVSLRVTDPGRHRQPGRQPRQLDPVTFNRLAANPVLARLAFGPPAACPLWR